jgi:translocator protein
MRISNSFKLIISLALPQTAGLFGSIFTVSAISSWYAALEKSALSPPNWAFGPVWVTLYLLIGISAYLVWKKADEDKRVKNAMRIFWIHLALNASWTPVFFWLQNAGLALVNILILWVLILVLIIKFYKISRFASYLLIPYIIWVIIASYLNYFIWLLN